MVGFYSKIQLDFKKNAMYPLEFHYTAGEKERVFTLFIKPGEDCRGNLESFGSGIRNEIQDTLKKITTPSVLFSRICITDASDVRHSLY